MVVNGATARLIHILVGKPFLDRGMRCDRHDAVAVMLSVHGASELVEEAADNEDEGSTGESCDCRGCTPWSKLCLQAVLLGL